MAFVTQRRSLIHRLLNGQPRELTFARSGAAYSPDTGAAVASGEPRIPWTSGYQGVMVEEGTTCLNFWSDDLTQSYWSKSGVSVTGSVVTEDTSTGSHFVRHNANGISATSGLPYVVSATVTPGTRTKFRLALGGAGGGGFADFDLTAKTVSGVGGPGAPSGGVADLGNGRVLVYVIVTAGATGTADAVLNLLDASGASSYTGVGSSLTIHRVNIQQKAYFTSQVLTTSAQATRNAETLTIPTTGILNLKQGTIICRVYVDGNLLTSGGPYYLFGHIDGASRNRILLRRNGGGWEAQVMNNAGSVTTSGFTTTLTAGWHVFGMRWSTAELSIWADGSVRDTDATPNLAESLQSLAYIGNLNGGQCNNPIDSLHIFDEALSDSLMAQYTTNPPTAPTDKHTLFLPLNGNLAPYGRGFSLGDYQAIRD